MFPEARIYCFEPLPEAFKELSKWAEKQRNGKIIAFNLVLGKIEGTFELFCHIEHNPSSSFPKITKICESLYTFTKRQVSVPIKLKILDNCNKSLNIALIPEILIKLDVQGYEDRVIGGKENIQYGKGLHFEDQSGLFV